MQIFPLFVSSFTEKLEKDSQVTKKLKDVVDKQRDEIRAKDHELAVRYEDIEAVRVYPIYTTAGDIQSLEIPSLSRISLIVYRVLLQTAPDAAASTYENQSGPPSHDRRDGVPR